MTSAPPDRPRPPFRIKICGVKTESDVWAAAEGGADAIGLNFYPKSVRCVEPELAAELATEALVACLDAVGVFVNASVEEILSREENGCCAAIQLHGDETPEFHAELLRCLSRSAAGGGSGEPPSAKTRTLRAFRVAPGELNKVETYLAECNRLVAMPDAMLVDGFSPHAYGGVGERADWNALASWPARANLPPLILAGGLTPENVGDAIRAVRPDGVDVASGVESSPGVKCPKKIAAFVAAARAAFAEIHSVR